MRDFVDVDATVVGFLLIIAIPALQTGERGRSSVTNRSDIPIKTGREGRVIQGGGCTRWERGCVEGQSRGESVGSQQGRREPAGERAAGTHRVQQNAILLVLLGVQHVITVGRGDQRSALEPVVTAFPHLLPGPHHSWQNRIPTKPGSYVPSGSIATGLAAEPSALARPRYGPREGSHGVIAPN